MQLCKQYGISVSSHHQNGIRSCQCRGRQQGIRESHSVLPSPSKWLLVTQEINSLTIFFQESGLGSDSYNIEVGTMNWPLAFHCKFPYLKHLHMYSSTFFVERVTNTVT
jgi:hypothetical protein